MPDLITHHLFGREVQWMLDEPISSIISKNQQMFDFGAMGPDFFFYYGTLPWKKYKDSKEVQDIGHKMHDEKITEVFVKFFELIKQIKNTEQREILFAYLAGMLTHYSIDRSAHPYIFYQSGFPLENENNEDRFDWYHKRVEMSIDLHILKRIGQANIREFKPYEVVNPKKLNISLLYSIYKLVLHNVYGVDVTMRQFMLSIQNMYRVFQLSHDPLGYKKSLSKLIEKITRKPDSYQYVVYPNQIPNEYDYLNVKKDSWFHPCDKEEISNQSFIEIFKGAKNEAVMLIEDLWRYLETGKRIEELKEVIADRSYATGRPWDEGQMQYHNCLFEKEKE